MDCFEFSRQWRFDTTEPDALLEMSRPVNRRSPGDYAAAPDRPLHKCCGRSSASHRNHCPFQSMKPILDFPPVTAAALSNTLPEPLKRRVTRMDTKQIHSMAPEIYRWSWSDRSRGDKRFLKR